MCECIVAGFTETTEQEKEIEPTQTLHTDAQVIGTGKTGISPEKPAVIGPGLCREHRSGAVGSRSSIIPRQRSSVGLRGRSINERSLQVFQQRSRDGFGLRSRRTEAGPREPQGENPGVKDGLERGQQGKVFCRLIHMLLVGYCCRRRRWGILLLVGHINFTVDCLLTL